MTRQEWKKYDRNDDGEEKGRSRNGRVAHQPRHKGAAPGHHQQAVPHPAPPRLRRLEPPPHSTSTSAPHHLEERGLSFYCLFHPDTNIK
ncbi:hypothetical protein E2C01_005274 [Portunus trituberculatus]|uniref:Uncharacterized protein n=1 Tax=Portunus trituberculatus TaxID=210409 RepID=A0A5B7CV41_PORTR|nr:hypothetical protein [Portunus trituberculatus]